MASFADGFLPSYFDKEGEVPALHVDLATVFLTLEEQDENEQLSQYLETDENFASSKNDVIELLLSEVMTVNVVIFMHILWFKIFQLFGDYLANHPDKVVVPRKGLTESMHCIYISIIGSVQYRQELCGLFGIEDTSGLNESHISVGSTLCMETYTFLIHKIAEMSYSDTVEDEQNLTGGLDGMPVEGLAKIRACRGMGSQKSARALETLRPHKYALHCPCYSHRSQGSSC